MVQTLGSINYGAKMHNPPEIRLPSLLSQGCFTFCVDDDSPEHPFVSGGAFCPEPLPLTTPSTADIGLGLLHGSAFDVTAILHADAGAVRFYFLFNLMDMETRSLLMASAEDRRFDLRMGNPVDPALPPRCVTVDPPFMDVLKQTEGVPQQPFRHWAEALQGAIPGILRAWDMRFKTPSTKEIYDCPVVMLPPWQFHQVRES